MRFGVPFYTEDVTKQARLVCQMDNLDLTILHCFSTHKEYEKWYKAFK